MSMQQFILRRLLLMIPLLLGITLIAFIISHSIPGDPIAAHLSDEALNHPEIVATFREQWGLDKPLPVQYWIYLKNLVRGNLGVSIRTRRPIVDDLKQFLPASMELAMGATLFSFFLGIPLGMISAVERNTIIDHIARVVSLIGVSMPIYWLALVSLLVFYFRLGWLPGPGRLDIGMDMEANITGMYVVDSLLKRDFETFSIAAKHLVLPTLVLGSRTTAVVTRMTRSSMLEELMQDYVRTARSKGLTERAVIVGHALRNALIPTVTVIGLSFGSVLAGTVLAETIFSWPGIGLYAYESSITLDFPAIMGVCLLIAGVYSVVNLMVDMSYAFLDPRLRFGER